MSIRLVAVMVAIWVVALSNGPVQVLGAAEAPAAPQPTPAGPALQPAPGGGEMVILAPESRYVTRAWRDASGRVYGACGRDGATPPDAEKR